MSVHPYGSFWLDVLDKGIKAVAVMVAAAWTYFRADTYRRKIEPSVSGEIFIKDEVRFVIFLCRLKNLGQSKYVIKQKGTYLGAETLHPAGRQELKGSEIFKDHGWIEPGEQIDEQLILQLPETAQLVAIRLSLRVISRGVEWNASCIVRETEVPAKPHLYLLKGDQYAV